MKKLLLSVLSCASAATLYAVDGVLLADSPSPATFSVYASDTASYVVTSLVDIAALPPVAWNAGDTVTAISGRGVATILADDAVSAGSVAFPPSSSGGVWTLVSSSEGTAKIGIPWFVYGDSGLLASGVSDAYIVDSRLAGPDRSVVRKEAPPVAYSGDEWIGVASKTATLTLAPSVGEATVLALDGTGVTPFNFTADTWTVTLAADGYPTRAAQINVKSGGFFVVFR